MIRDQYRFPWTNKDIYKFVHWLENQEFFVFFHSNQFKDGYSQFEGTVAIGNRGEIKLKDTNHSFEALNRFRNKVQDTVFGYLSYDLKNELFSTSSANYDGLNFDDLRFFQAEKIIKISASEICFHYASQNEALKDFQKIVGTEIPANKPLDIQIHARMNKREYLDRVNQLKKHIKRGDLYEANFCQEFYTEVSSLPLAQTYQKLNEISLAPFSVFMKMQNQVLISASPERFVQKKGRNVISQPIKGTSKRSKDIQEDKILIEKLEINQKERAENIMIVDLVRNDLSRIAEKGSVQVKELCKVYSFKQVHQMISTVEAHAKPCISSENIIKDLFPMGSMTGAPKKSALELIEKLEISKRGLYSGAVGYITKLGDFDFNVVIRSILYNSQSNYLSYSVGSAITDGAQAEQEYEECLVKAKAMKDVLTGIV